MVHSATQILGILDQCADAFRFPMLDNGYIYLAATRLTLLRSDRDWGLAIEVFGFSPRAGGPDLGIDCFGNRLVRGGPENFVSRDAYYRHLGDNPFNDGLTLSPVDDASWQDEDDLERVKADAGHVSVRGEAVVLPTSAAGYAAQGVQLERPPAVATFELCRYLAAVRRPLVLATDAELRRGFPDDLAVILQLDEWHHPDVVDPAARPSGSDTFQQLAQVLVTGDIDHYAPTLPPNTHWRHWPDGGSL